MTYDSGAAVWSFDPTRWGVCVQAPTRGEALATWRRRFGAADVVGLVEGDEQAFERDHEPASDLELVLTTDVLARQRERALTTLDRLPRAVLDHDDPAQGLPGWARWRTIRQRLWHVCDTESRYYLPRAGLPTRPRAPTLEQETPPVGGPRAGRAGVDASCCHAPDRRRGMDVDQAAATPGLARAGRAGRDRRSPGRLVALIRSGHAVLDQRAGARRRGRGAPGRAARRPTGRRGPRTPGRLPS